MRRLASRRCLASLCRPNAADCIHADGTGDAPFDFRAFRNELHIYVQGWTNLKQIVLFAPQTNQTDQTRQTFLSVLYEETKRAVAGVKMELDNPHHVRVVEVLNEGLDGLEYARRSLAFFENARS